MIQLLNANALHIPLADKSVNCVVTSPPYYGLRDYGVDGQIGLEETPDEYVANMVQVFREVWRVLRDDGTLWLNLGDSYSGNRSRASNNGRAGFGNPREGVFDKGDDLPAKNLIGVPWRVAFALQADGWYLRQDIIWHKPNPMPESVTDRCTKAHEYIFLLSKNARYYYDHEAILEPNKEASLKRWKGEIKESHQQRNDYSISPQGVNSLHKIKSGNILNPKGRNKRSVWTVTTKGYAGAHFATYPPELIEPCILAGCPEGGIVLDPFSGSGTTLQVARQHNRNAIGLDLSMTYIQDCAMERLQLRHLREWGNGKKAEANLDGLVLFQEVSA